MLSLASILTQCDHREYSFSGLPGHLPAVGSVSPADLISVPSKCPSRPSYKCWGSYSVWEGVPDPITSNENSGQPAVDSASHAGRSLTPTHPRLRQPAFTRIICQRAIRQTVLHWQILTQHLLREGPMQAMVGIESWTELGVSGTHSSEVIDFELWIQTRVSRLVVSRVADRFFTIWASRKLPACAQILPQPLKIWVTLPKLLSLSEPVSSPVNNSAPSGVMRIKWVSDCRALPAEKVLISFGWHRLRFLVSPFPACPRVKPWLFLWPLGNEEWDSHPRHLG